MFNVDASVERSVRNMMHRVYGWMSAALAVTAVLAYAVAHTPALINLVTKNPIIFFGLVLAQLGVVFYLQHVLRSNHISINRAYGLFFVYAALTGITCSVIFLYFTLPSIAVTFVATAGMFGAMALYGYFTNKDLSSLGSILFMALIGLIIGSLINFFLKSSMLEYLISGIGVAVFALLTAYDVQNIKQVGQQLLINGYGISKAALFGALKLYLDFINLFMYLLNFLGKKRND
ncbi:MAG TPA: Bax inhibitor-1/YccA family protein [Candidatus Babeliales bacterium]|nr:Bax inhibitor-1/YccA family protein [Candidatus Babeliales bacterium]